MIDRMQREEKTGAIRGEDGRTFAFDEMGLADLDYDTLVLGMNVEFDVGTGSETGTEEPVAVHIHPAAEQISPSAAKALQGDEDVSLNTDPVADQLPPREVKADEVDESSWQSFPASDPPSPGGTT